MLSLKPEEWSSLLRTERFGRGSLFFEEQMDSTNRYLKQKAGQGAKDGSVAVCAEQTDGRGRMQRAWLGEKGAMLPLSLLIEPKAEPGLYAMYTLCAALAVASSVRELTGNRLCPAIKWPNDVILDGKKLCGILCETVSLKDNSLGIVCGVGINVGQRSFPIELEKRATSLRMALDGRDIPKLGECAAAFLNTMEKKTAILEGQGSEALLEQYRPLCVTLGRQVRVLDGSGQWLGTALSVCGDGTLLVAAEKGDKKRVSCGDVSIRGLADYVG